MSMFTLTPQQIKRQEEANLRKVRDLLRLPDNKKCFDCPTKSPFFVNVTVQTFICSRCSGLVREVGHRVKSISASSFSNAEVLALQQGGNGIARQHWLSTYTYRAMEEEPSSDTDVRGFIRQKYYEQKWLDHDKLRAHTERVRQLYQSLFDEEGLRRPGAKDPPVPGMPTTTPSRPASLQLLQSAWLPKPPTSPAATTATFRTPPPSSPVPTSASSPSALPLQPPQSAPPLEAQFKDLLSLDDEAAPQPTSNHAARAPSPPTPAPPPSVPTTPRNRTTDSHRNSTNSIFAELAGLEPSRRATYSGGILTPTTPNQPSASHTLFTKPPAQPSPPKSNEPDPYAALRTLPKTASPPPPQFSYDADFDDEPFSERRGSDEFSWTEFSASTSTTTDSLAQQQQQHQKPISAELFSDLDPIAQMKRSRA